MHVYFWSHQIQPVCVTDTQLISSATTCLRGVYKKDMDGLANMIKNLDGGSAMLTAFDGNARTIAIASNSLYHLCCALIQKKLDKNTAQLLQSSQTWKAHDEWRKAKGLGELSKVYTSS